MDVSEVEGRIKIFSLTNRRGVSLRVTNYGGIILSLHVPDRNGRLDNVVLGHETPQAYARDTSYVGAIVGRYANRIANARFDLDGATYRLSANEGPHQLHGGVRGFNRVRWEVERVADTSIVLRYVSRDGEEGFPGTLDTRVTYTLTEDNALVVDYFATTDKPTPVNLTQHSYFNLGGAGDVLGHLLQINAEAMTPVGSDRIPTGAIGPVAGTRFDFRRAKPIQSADYDCNFVLAGPVAATLIDPPSGRRLDVRTTEPGMQLYTGNPRGVCLETQHYPDSPNRANFPAAILRPGSQYRSQTVFAFGIEEGS